MSTAQYFIPVPASVAKVISDAVQTVAQKKDLHVEAWVQDVPLWFVTPRVWGEGIIRRLQVGVYALGTSNEIRIIPEVFRFVPGQREVVMYEATDPKHIVSRPFDVTKGDLENALFAAWETALELAPPPEPPVSGQPTSSGRSVVGFRVSQRFAV
jgi:hypothetical protein